MNLHTRFLRYKDRNLHISVINAVLFAGSLGPKAHGTVDSKGSCRNRQTGFITRFSSHLRREVLSQAVPVRSNSHQRKEIIASVNPGHDTGPVFQVKCLSQAIMPDQDFVSPVFAETTLNESKHIDKTSEQEYNKVEINSMSGIQTEDAKDCKDFALEQEIRESVLRLNCMCTTRPASHLAFMMRDFRAGLHRSNINSMFFTRCVNSE